MDKSWSFASRKSTSNVGRGEEENEALKDLPKVLEEVDAFICNTPKDVPDCVGVFARLIECMVDRYTKGNVRYKFGHEAEDDKTFLDSLDRISKLCTMRSLGALDQITCAQEKAMSFLENELCALLDDQKVSRAPKKSLSFSSSSHLDSDLCPEIDESPEPPPQDQEQQEEDIINPILLPNFSSQKLSILNKIITAMITAGYQIECCQAFASYRRSAFKTALQSVGGRQIKMEDLYRMQWESLEGEIATWNNVVRHCTTVLFNAERRLYDSLFPDHPSISQNLFAHLARPVIIHFLNFAQGVVLTKRSAEKLFKFLDMYETLRDVVEPGILGDPYLEPCAKELAYEVTITKERIVEAIVAMFGALDNSVESDRERIPVPNGAVHPLTRYVMNYLKYACEYKDTLEKVLELGGININNINVESNQNQGIEQEAEGTPRKSTFQLQLMRTMELLHANAERKSKLYRDPALRYIFLMNNGRYIVQKIKGCGELRESMGDNWCRRRQSGLRSYHKCYQRETWIKVLQCLNPEGLQQQGTGNKVSKQLLKERLKSFNATFEDIHKTQSSWMVSDEQLQSELRVSISALVIPAYRTFVGRFKHHLESSRNIDKYIKYHADDIEILIDDLFGGNTPSMARRRT